MVSLFIVSHSEKIAHGVKELALEMAPEVKLASAGGTIDGKLGSSYDKIYTALSDIYTEDGVLVLFDLGSSYMTAELVKETLILEGKDKIHIVDAALVEGAITAVVQISLGLPINEVMQSLEKLKLGKI
ncbi:dihydroxyacetone kinase phosphoryl donor subunit DhaM [Candidatus Clostridium stratigraminis]|uniref:phosphoenolpyruvate--glycerone phosphotransferase n=1 Tax=Candidatus Clostridium stratigraminis TaxID=3381661 RepID=A0ABW8T4M3_9CLOT